MRKPRSDSPLAKLPEHVREQLIAWLVDENLSYAEARERLHLDCNVETSEAALGGFYQHFCRPYVLRRSAEAAERLQETTGELMQSWDEPSIALVKQTYFELLSAPHPDAKLVAVFAMQIADINRGKLERDKLEFNREKHADTHSAKMQDLALQREKFETDAAKKAMAFVAEIKSIAANKSLDSDARVEQVRLRLFGAAPTQEVTPS